MRYINEYNLNMCKLEYYKGQPCNIKNRECEKCPKFLNLPKFNIIKKEN